MADAPVRWVVALAVVVVLAAVGLFVWKNVIGGAVREDEQSKTYSNEISQLEVDGDSDSGNVDVSGKALTVDADSGTITVRVPEGDEAYDVHAEANSGSGDVEVNTDPSASRRVIVISDSGVVAVEYA